MSLRIPLQTELWRELNALSLVRVEALLRDDETGSTLVAYRQVDPRGARFEAAVAGILWARPLETFLKAYGPADQHPIGK